MRTTHTKNKIIDCGSYYSVCIYDLKSNEIARAKIDKEDLDKITKHKWSLDGRGYAACNIGKKRPKMHRMILNSKSSLDTDHINNDPLDNRKHNLRLVTRSRNRINSKKIKGYCWHKRDKIWQAYITIDHIFIGLGTFINKQDAIVARLEAEKTYL